MSNNVLKTKETARKFIDDLVMQVTTQAIREAVGDPPPPPAPAPPPAAAPAGPPAAPSTVSVNKVATGTAGTADTSSQELQKGQITIEMVIEKLNSIRSGRSFKDQNIQGQMSSYFNDLNDNEKLALYAFLKGIAQIVTGEISGDAAMDPTKTHPELEVKDKGQRQVHSIKPNIIRRPATVPAALPSQEDTTAPSPIVPRRR